LVSILIANHNYGRYLPEALDAALAQSWGDVEVVVADDGSTDDSRDVIAGYGDRVTALLQGQAGQASALNAAFERCSGEVICLLDADDVFTADKAERVVAALSALPGARLVHHQMRTIDAQGYPSGGAWPRRLWHGDLRERVERTAGWFPHAVTSGLAFPRDYAEQMFPIPTAPRIGRGPLGEVPIEIKPDTWLAGPAPFLGPVAAVERVLALYRVHGGNKSGAGAGRTPAAMNRRYAQYLVEHEVLAQTLRERFAVEAPLRPADHFELMLHRRAFGEISAAGAALHALRSPALPPASRPREAVRAALGRGWARRVDRA
jgi:hypothetical protein